jgi:hypothetical protein
VSSLASRLTFVCMYQVAEAALRPQEKLVMTDAYLLAVGGLGSVLWIGFHSSVRLRQVA